MEKAKVLVVEDEGIVAADIKASLLKLGYEVTAVVPTGEEALLEVEKNRPDLALMDIILQGEISGIESAGEMLTSFKVPVVYLSAHSDDSTVERAKKTGPYGYLVKPFEERELHTTIEMALYKYKMEMELRNSEEWLSTTLRSIGDAVIATDEKGRIKFMNAVAQSLTAWSEDDAVGRPLEEVYCIANEETGREVRNSVENVIRLGRIVGLANHTVLTSKDGALWPIEDSGAPIRDSEGKIIGVVLVFRNIKEKREIEAELMRAKKLDSVGILAGGIAHDFNNLLTVVLGHLSLAKLSLNPDDKLFKGLSKAEKATIRAKNLTQQLLTFAKGGAPIQESVSIPELVTETTHFALVGSNVRSEFSIPGNLWPAEVDEGQISQVIHNIVINADHVMPEGGVLQVNCDNVTIENEDNLALASGRYVEITIKDNGIGIPKDHIEKIFDPFFTTKQKGSGLGLATSYSIVNKHKGLITVESELGKGTTFHTYLPASHEKAINKKEIESTPVTGTGRVLVMDDEKSVREIAGSMLVRLGYEVVFAEDGESAVALYKEAYGSDIPFDSVILDITIPGGMGGEETLKNLLNIDPEVKGIVSSGYSEDPVMGNYRKYGFCGVIAKPYKVVEMSRVVDNVIKGKGERSED